MPKAERNYGYDILRVIACIMVVILHSPMPGANAASHNIFLSSLSFLTAPCVPLFFMLSGALLLGSKMSTGEFLKRRFGKFISPLIIWSILYLINKIIIGKISTAKGLVVSLLSIPFSAQEGLLWFMYTLAGLYLLTPILSSWLIYTSKRAVEFYLTIWIVTLLFPYFEQLLNLHTTITDRADILYYFSGFVGYYLFGWYMKRYKDSIISKYGWKKVLGVLSVLCVSGLAFKGIDKTLRLGMDELGGFWFQSAVVAIFCIFWWFVAMRLSLTPFVNRAGVKRIVNILANYSFGIYLMHILIMRPWLWDVPFIKSITNYPIQTFTIVAIDMAISVLLCWLISLTPWSKYIIGYQPMKESKVTERVTGAI